MKSENVTYKHCKDCKYYIEVEKGYQGASKGKCSIRETDRWSDYRYGSTKACLKFKK